MIDTAVSDFFNIYNNNYSFVFVSRILTDDNLNVIENKKAQPEIETLNPSFCSGYEMVQKMGLDIMTILGFYSSIIIKKELWNKINMNMNDNTSEFKYLEALLYAIRLNSCFIIKQPGVYCRLAYRGFQGNDSFVWLDNYIEVFRFAYNVGYDEMRCKEMIRSILKSFSSSFVISKALGKRNGNLFQFIKTNLWYNEKYYNHWFIISLLPQFILKILYKTAVKIQKFK
jgi:hypothetical protein